MTGPTLSIGMSNYNYGRWIGEALDALLSQSLRPTEIILVDDASTDNSLDVIYKFAERYPIIRVIRNLKNMGIIRNSERVLRMVRGEYYYGAASDDRVLPGFFEKSVRLLIDHPQAGLCCSDPVYFEDGTGRVRCVRLGISDRPRCFSPDEVVALLRAKPFPIAGHTTVIRRSALAETGYMVPELKWHYDWFSCYTIVFRYGMCYTPERLASLRVHPNAYNRGMRSRSERRQVSEHLLALLESAEYADVRAAFRSSGILSSLLMPTILHAIVRDPRHWDYLTPLFLCRALRHSARSTLIRLVPPAVKRLLRRLRDHGRPTGKPVPVGCSRDASALTPGHASPGPSPKPCPFPAHAADSRRCPPDRAMGPEIVSERPGTG